MRIVVSMIVPGVGVHTVSLRPSLVQGVSIPSTYLVSAGQQFEFSISACTYEDEPRLPGGWIDARRVAPILGLAKPASWSYDLPTTRSATDIMREAAQHGVDFPGHGTDCVCMDELIRELRAQVSAVIPAYTEEMDHQPEDWKSRYNTLSRVQYILLAAGRNL